MVKKEELNKNEQVKNKNGEKNLQPNTHVAEDQPSLEVTGVSGRVIKSTVGVVRRRSKVESAGAAVAPAPSVKEAAVPVQVATPTAQKNDEKPVETPSLAEKPQKAEVKPESTKHVNAEVDVKAEAKVKKADQPKQTKPQKTEPKEVAGDAVSAKTKDNEKDTKPAKATKANEKDGVKVIEATAKETLKVSKSKDAKDLNEAKDAKEAKAVKSKDAQKPADKAQPKVQTDKETAKPKHDAKHKEEAPKSEHHPWSTEPVREHRRGHRSPETRPTITPPEGLVPKANAEGHGENKPHPGAPKPHPAAARPHPGAAKPTFPNANMGVVAPPTLRPQSNRTGFVGQGLMPLPGTGNSQRGPRQGGRPGYNDRRSGTGGQSGPGGQRSFGNRPSYGGGGGYGGQRSGGYSGGYGGSGGQRSFGNRPGFGDKDAEEAPRQTRSPRQAATPVKRPGEGEIVRKNDNRQAYAQKTQLEHKKREAAFGRERQSERLDEFFGGGRTRMRKRKVTSAPQVVTAQLKSVVLPATITVKEFAEMLKKASAEIIMRLMNYGVMATVNQEVDYDTCEVIANEYGIECSLRVDVTEEDILFDDSIDDEADLVSRPPVVVVMGHVDHGKTSILDYIRKASVASGEAGGITQHIGAYTVDVKGRSITFLDTPGHEAFTTMRARGAQVTDIAIIVVAGDDGVMPQTIEAINHAKAANTEIIVAVNKIDKPGLNLDLIRTQMAENGIMCSEWGGGVSFVQVSAKVGTGMNDLLETILITADVMEMKANPNRQAKGTVIEAKLDKNRGPVATILVQRGTLRQGATVVVGSSLGRIRAMTDDKGRQITKALPSQPVEILGLPEVPSGGDIFYEVSDEKVGRSLVDKRRSEDREKQLKQGSRVTLDNLFSKMAEGEIKTLPLIVKADVQGSVEAVRQSLEKIGNKEVQVQVIHGAVGAITESDIRLAEVSNAIVIGFNVRPATNASQLAEANGVDVRLYRVIYTAIEDVEAALKGMLAPTYKEQVLGHAEVRNTFKVSGIGTIAGCYVLDGKFNRNNKVRVVRDGVVIHEGKLASLRRFKDDVKEVATGYECGMGIERFNDVKDGDVFEAFEMQEVEAE